MKLVTAHSRKLLVPEAELQLRGLPKDPWPCIDEFLIFCNTKDEVRQVKALAYRLRRRWPIRVETHRKVTEPLPPVLRSYIDNDFGFKMLLPLVVEAPFMWIDGDVLITRDPTRHLKYEGWWAGIIGVPMWMQTGSKKAGNIKPTRLGQEVHDEFGVWAKYEHNCDPGLFVVPDVDPEYEDRLRRFFKLKENVRAEAERLRSKEAFHTLDQRFLTVWYALHKGLCVKGGFRLPKDHPLYGGTYGNAMKWEKYHRFDERFRSTFLHYNCGKWKTAAIGKYTGWLAPAGGFLPERQPQAARS